MTWLLFMASAIGAEVCDMYEEKTTSLSLEAERLGSSKAAISYSFTSSNDGEVILIVVTGNYSAREIHSL